MGHEFRLRLAGGEVRLDARDLAAAADRAGPADPEDPLWRQAGEHYVDAHPRGSRHSDRQRLALLRRLAAGPATTEELLGALRGVGWVGASDLENRLREIRGGDARGGMALPVESTGGTHRLAEPFPVLDALQLTSLGHVRSLVTQTPTPLTLQAVQALDGMVPGIGAGTGQPGATGIQLPTADMRRFEQARTTRTPVVVAYHSMNSGREKTYTLVPVTYVPVGPAMKVVCVEVDGDGMPGLERQFALERIRSVGESGLDPLPEPLELRTEELRLHVMGDLYRIMVDRNQFGIRSFHAEEVDEQGTRDVRGSFPVVLGWDVMEQMCAWAGSVVVYEPLWLVNAVVRRLHAGLDAMHDGALRLVKPDPTADFEDLSDALYPGDLADDPVVTGPRKLPPPKG